MANFYDPCERFHNYQRLEGRPRETELDDSLAAKIHDPLCMLARQYQFGEFQGEDAGSAISAKVALNKARLCGFRTGKMKLRAIDPSLPLETVVERLAPDIDHKMSLRMGQKFLELLSAGGNAMMSWPVDDYRAQFLARFPFEVPAPDKELPEGELAVQAREKTLRQANLFLKAISGKAINGAMMWHFLEDQASRANSWVAAPDTTEGFIDPAHEAALIEAVTAWLEWVRQTWNFPPKDQPAAWQQEKMEYDFDVSIDEGDDKTTVLHAEGYHHGHLDWFAFDVGEARRDRNLKEPVSDEGITREVKAVIPAQASFQGMPNARWWELEDCRVDPGNFKATDTDVAALLISQFALYYSNDWLMIPYVIPMGSMVEVEGIIVTDTFGNRTFIEAAHKESGVSWKDWTMFSLAEKASGQDAGGIEQRIFVPPAAVKVLEGEAVEQIRFIRDEMANMVWGIEKIVPDRMGGGTDGYECAAAIDHIYRMLEEEDAAEVPDHVVVDPSSPEEMHLAKTTRPQLKYTLGNTVTENWIPFIPVHIERSNREMTLQRASMPRISAIKPPHQVRPRTPMLREGIDANDNQIRPLFINEEEVPRAGATVTGSYQRSRWYNGKIVLWYGRRKTTGRGEGSSGLRFDHLAENL